ncbi:MAG: hypothetical protein JNL74_18000 [Fibrobacteres bacterium]|nr:hypothetical protein [Fibrobacterota bacterium]
MVKGLKDFDLPDSEQYFIHIDPSVHVLCQTTFSGEYGDSDLYTAGTAMPYAYTKTYGKGRIFVANWAIPTKTTESTRQRRSLSVGCCGQPDNTSMA